MDLVNRSFYAFIKKMFDIFQSLGFHLTPVHYYEPIPDTRNLDKSLWNERETPPGLDLNEAGQLSLLEAFKNNYLKEYSEFPKHKTGAEAEYYSNNGSFGPVDAEILYCMVRWFKPKRIYEIGSGFSTLVSAKAVLKNEQESGVKCELVSFEPYPNKTLKKGFPGLTSLVENKIQNIKLETFKGLSDNDMLFIDSSHVLSIGSDVWYEYLNILPFLNKGVIIHCHDIYIPHEYPKDWVFNKHWFWNESYLLQAFLSFNVAFETLWGGIFMNHKHPEKLKAAFPGTYNGIDEPGSFWIRKTK